jgi:GntP family gluconate:H+ symporter
MPIEAVFLLGLTVLLVLAIPLRVNAFVCLLLAAATIGFLSELGPARTLQVMQEGFGSTVAKIGVIIIFGVLLGQYLEDSRAAERLAHGLVRVVGERRSPLAMALGGYLIAIPVFSDVGYVIMCPLAKALSRRSGVSFHIIGVSLAGGLLATHVLVPPTPGPLAVAGLLGIDLGRMILWGAFVALCMTLGGWLWAVLVMPRFVSAFIPVEPGSPKLAPAGPGSPPPATGTNSDCTHAVELPGLGAALLPLLLPLILILADTTSRMLLPDDSTIRAACATIGNANVAVSLGAVVALALLHRRLRAAGRPGRAGIDGALRNAGAIIFITAAGGSLGEVLEASGAGASIATLFARSGLPFLLIPFAIAGVLKTVQGSGTVAVVTAATLCLPIAQELAIDPLVIALSSGAGARLVCHVNDSFFWVFANLGGLDTRTTLKTLSVASVAMAFSGLAGTWIVSLLLG